MAVRVKSLHIYPLKSATGIDLINMKMDEVGPLWDRRWMAITESGQFITQRTHPQMALIKCAINNDLLILSQPKGNKLKLPLKPENSADLVPTSIFGQSVNGFSCGEDAHLWISEFLGIKSKLIYHSASSPRLINPKYATQPNQQVSFADGFPLLLTNQNTLNELNQKLDNQIEMNRFRPNIVIEGAPSEVEDSWTEFKIGDISFSNVKPCSRCKIITVDPQKGIFTNSNVIQVLKSYRSKDQKIFFGINLIHKTPGTIKVGDELSFTN